jgi:hypothetical protein
MRIRQTYKETESALAQAGTYQKDLNYREGITCLDILFKNTNGSTSNTAKMLSDEVTEIALVANGEAIWSLPLKECIAMSYYLTGRNPFISLTEAANGVQYEGFRMPFGLFYGDLQNYLLPTNYRSVQLKIVNSFTEHASTGWANDAGAVTVIVHSFEDQVAPPKGILRVKSHYDITSVASGIATAPLPTMNPWIGLGIVARKTAVQPEAVITYAELNCDSGSFTPFDKRIIDIKQDNIAELKPLSYDHVVLEADDATFSGILWSHHEHVPIAHTDDFISTVEAQAGETVQVGLYDLTTPGTPALGAASAISLRSKGWVPHGTVWVPFGDVKKGDIFPANLYGHIDLKMTQILAAGQLRVIVAELAKK